MARWELEDTYSSPWERWADEVERLLGHDLDGSQSEEGYSLDHAYDMWREGLTIPDAVAKIEHSKQVQHDLRWS